MADLLYIGFLIGSLVGLAHGLWLVRAIGGPKGLYFGFWALALWTLFGPYVLCFWVVGVIFWLIGQVFPLRRIWSRRGLKGLAQP